MSGSILDGASEGRLHDRYDIRQQLGKTAGRRTLLAVDRHTQHPVVIKLLTFDQDFVWDDFKLFQREAETLKALSHPAIPQYLDFFELEPSSDRRFALVQSYVEGRSIDAYLKRGRIFSEAEAKQIAEALLQILIYLHQRQPPVIHRDIKPSNVLLGEASGKAIGTVHLVDFGSVQTLAASQSGTITVVGTYGYMPPEQFGGYATPVSDLYSLGATLIAIVTGKHPADLPQKNLRIQFEQAAYLSTTFTNWLKWLTEPNPEHRPASAEMALQGLRWRSIPMHSSQHHRRTVPALSLFSNTIWRSCAIGLGTGGMFGGLFALAWGIVGSAEWAIIGALFGGLCGGTVGGIFGVVHGALFGVVTQFFYSPLSSPLHHRRSLRFIGMFLNFSGIFLLLRLLGVLPATVSLLTPGDVILLAAALIAGLAGGLAGQHVATWYEQATRNKQD